MKHFFWLFTLLLLLNCAKKERALPSSKWQITTLKNLPEPVTNNAVVEVFASDETGTWTITVTTPNGMTCLVASGQSFEALAEALPAKGNDA